MPEFYNPAGDTQKHGVKLPHWQQGEVTQFVSFRLADSLPRTKLMQSWKGISARRMGAGSIWQKNYRDTLVRDASHFANAVRYIRRNPVKLREGTFTLWQSERAKAIF
jgi:hypothetical protein